MKEKINIISKIIRNEKIYPNKYDSDIDWVDYILDEYNKYIRDEYDLDYIIVSKERDKKIDIIISDVSNNK